MATLSPESWLAVPDEAFERHATSPRPRSDQLGIGIDAPKRVVAGERLPITGFFALTGPDLLWSSPWIEAATFVASRRGGMSVGHFHQHGKPVPPTPPFGGRAPTAEELRRRGVEYFTSNVRSLFDDSFEPGTYFVYAFRGAHVSNVVRIEVVDPETSP